MMQIPRPPSTGFKSVGAAVDAAAGLADAADAADHPLAVGAVFQVHAELVGRRTGHLFPVPNVTFALEHFGQAAFHLRQGHVDVRPLHAHGVADAGQHVGDGVGHHIIYCPSYQLAFLTPGITPSSARLRKQIRQIPNFRYTARGRPQIRHRRTPGGKLRRPQRRGDLRFTCHARSDPLRDQVLSPLLAVYV